MKSAGISAREEHMVRRQAALWVLLLVVGATGAEARRPRVDHCSPSRGFEEFWDGRYEYHGDYAYRGHYVEFPRQNYGLHYDPYYWQAGYHSGAHYGYHAGKQWSPEEGRASFTHWAYQPGVHSGEFGSLGYRVRTDYNYRPAYYLHHSVVY
jgi:hypothetical protein